MLARHKTDGCGEVPATFESIHVTSHRQQVAGGDGSNARNGKQTSAGIVLDDLSFDLSVEFG